MVLASSFLSMQKRPLYPDRVGLLACPPLPCSPVLFRISPLGSQKGCRRQAWHTAGSVGAGSQLGPAGRDQGLSWHLRPHRELTGASSHGLWLQGLHLGGHAVVPAFPPNPSPLAASTFLTGTGPAPGRSLDWSHRHPHVAALPKIRCHEWEYKLSPSSRTGKSILLPKGGRRKSPEKGCQVRRARRRGFHRLCFEP